MSFYQRTLTIAICLIILTNLIIFFNREKGFDYIKYSNKEELYPHKAESKFLQKWSEANERYSMEEINQGRAILRTNLGIDTILSEQDKVTRIAAWIHNAFILNPRGRPADTLKKLTSLEVYLYLTKHKNEKMWCGHFQFVFAFFSTCAGLINRYIDIMPENNSVGDVHAVNEVFLHDQNRWVIVDVTRNRLLIKNGPDIFSAAEYFDHKINLPSDPVSVTQSIGQYLTDSLLAGAALTDPYFNSNYSLRYYRIVEFSRTARPFSKIKRYIFGEPLYEVYDPVGHHNNFLFWIKQFFLLAFLITFFLFVFTRLKRVKIQGKSHVRGQAQ